MSNIPSLLKNFFSSEMSLQDQSIFVTRKDGILLYSNIKDGSEQAVSALVSGLWQAAKSITDFLPRENGAGPYRLSFDTSSKGLYIFPLLLHQEEYFLAVTYAEQLNPGQLKQKIKHTALQLSEFIIKKGQHLTKEKTAKREGYLFSQISDEEMDHLFSFAGE